MPIKMSLKRTSNCTIRTVNKTSAAWSKKHSWDAIRVKKLEEEPVELPIELTMPDRRALDLAVFGLLGVSNAAEREKLCDELHFETANHCTIPAVTLPRRSRDL